MRCRISARADTAANFAPVHNAIYAIAFKDAIDYALS